MKKEQKKQEILKLAQKQNGITITDVRNLLKITWVTARMYLHELQFENKLMSEKKSHQYLFYIKK